MKNHSRQSSFASRVLPVVAGLLTILPMPSIASFADTQPVSAEEKNIYKMEPISPKSLDQWKTLPGTRIRFSWRGKTDPYLAIQQYYDVSKAEDTVHGMYREGLNLPVPEEVRFWICGDEPCMWVSMCDKKGHTFMSQVPIDMKYGQWVQIKIPIKPAPGAPPVSLEDLDSIAILEMDGVGENPFSETKVSSFCSFELVYPEGQGPKNVVYTREDIDSKVSPLDTSIPKIEALIEKAKAVGAETRYFKVSLTVLKKYRHEVLSMIKPEDPSVAMNTANYLLSCSERLEKDVKEAISRPEKSIHVPNVRLQNLKVTDGGLFSGKRPVYLAGVVGWFDEKRFEDLSNLGFTVISYEIGPSSTLPAEGKTDPASAEHYAKIMDYAAKKNIAFDALISPHYMPDWAYKKWPDLDPENRRSGNPFMPWNIRSPHLKEMIANHLQVLIPKIKDNPALLAYDLVNEAWYRPLLGVSDAEREGYLKAHPGMTKWQAEESLSTDATTSFVKWYINELQKYDKKHPAYIKCVGSDEVQGVNREDLGNVLTANGMDNFPTYPDLTGELAADMSTTLLRIDFHRTLTPNKAIMDGEYHACSCEYETPESYMRAALWDTALHGKDSSALWVQDRVDGGSVDWHANCVEVLGHTALDFLRLGPEIRAFELQKPTIAVMYGGTGIRETYLASLFQDSQLGIVTNTSAVQKGLGQYKAVVIPFGFRPSPEAARKIAAFEKAGGKVVRGNRNLAVEMWADLHKQLGPIAGTSLVTTNRWGVECRSTTLNGRKLFYLINYNRTPVDLKLVSSWDLSKCKELRTNEMASCKSLHLESLDFKIFEAVTR